MIAPIDSKAEFEAGGESFTLRLNFRTLALAKKNGVNLMSGETMDPIALAVVVRCLASQDHPKMTDEVAFAIVVQHTAEVTPALEELFAAFVGGESAEGKAEASKS